jgi:Ca2+-binding RTX toxin-like protein
MSVQPPFRPQLESLETRECPAGLQAYVTLGNLYVLGTPSNDFINITQSGNQIAVTGTQISVGSWRVNSVDASTIAKVVVYGNGGGDFINLASIKNDALIYGSSGDDIIRCGSGNDMVYNGGGFDTVFHPYNPSAPFVNGEAITDVRQGQSPLCQTDAAIAEAVQEGHNFANDIQYLGNNLFNVKLQGGKVTEKVHYDGWSNSSDPVVTNGEFWTILEQRARLELLGIDPTAQHSTAQWNAFNQADYGQLYSIANALYDFTGRYPKYSPIGAATPQALQADLAQGDYLVAQSQSGSGVTKDGVVANHAYAVLKVYYEDGTWKVRLYNPWGSDRDNGSTIDALDKSHPAANDGIITLSWQQFTNPTNFKGYFVAVKN